MKELATLPIKAETKSSSILKIVIDILIDGKTDTQLKPYAPKKKPTSTCSRSGTRVIGLNISRLAMKLLRELSPLVSAASDRI